MASDVAVPIAFPDYMARSDEIQANVPAGHAGIMFASGTTGMTLYYEYGRYDPANAGLVRKQPIPNVKPGGLSLPGLKPVFRKLSQVSGHGGKLRGAWIELPSGAFEKMKSFAEQRMTMNQDGKRKKYDITSNNCCTFARDVAEAGGASVGLSSGVGAYVLQGTILPHVAEAAGSLVMTMSSPVPKAFLNQLEMAYPAFMFEPADTWTSTGRGDLATQ